jgi:hypothetical protein
MLRDLFLKKRVKIEFDILSFCPKSWKLSCKEFDGVRSLKLGNVFFSPSEWDEFIEGAGQLKSLQFP